MVGRITSGAATSRRRVDADTAEPVRLTTGPLLSAMLASSAIPGVFPAVHRDGRDLYDGGLVANTPVLEALAMGAASLVVLDCHFPDRRIGRPTNLLEAALHASTIVSQQQMEREVPVAAQQVPVLVMPGATYVAGLSPMDFTGAAPLIGSAYDVSRVFLASLQLAGPGVYRR